MECVYKSLRISAIYLVFFLSLGSSGLEVGEKLTIEILDVTESRRTIKINRGSNDGLTKGEHAKFYLTQSIIARAVSEIVKPTQSVWSVYRIVHPRLLARNELMNLKITEPVRITSEKRLNIVGNSSQGVRIDQSASGDYVAYSDLVRESTKKFSIDKNITLKSRSDISQYEGRNLKSRKFEIWTQLGFHFYSSSVQSNNQDEFTASEFFNQFMGGAEFYLGRWLSIQLMGQYLQESLLSFDGAITDSVLFEYGGALQFYFSNPHRSNKSIFYLSAGAALGNITDAFAGGASSSTAAQNTQNVSGTSQALFGGLGMKYHFSRGFGVRVMVDLYKRNDTFAAQENSVAWTRSKQGPRMMLGLSYRF